MSQKLKLIISEHGGEHTIGYMDEKIASYWLENHERDAFENCLFDREKLDCNIDAWRHIPEEFMLPVYHYEYDQVLHINAPLFIEENQISVSVVGQWRSYSVTLAWSEIDETLRLICTFDMEPPAHRLNELYSLLNAVNDNCWAGSFTYWGEKNLMIFRYGLILAGGQMASTDQIDTMISAAVLSAERYYPAFQLVTWGEEPPESAMQVAITEAYGHA